MKITDSAHRLQEIMEVYGLKQSDVAVRTGISKATISHYVRGTREPRQDNITLICEAFNVDPAWMMGHDVPMRKPSPDEAASLDAEISKKMMKLSDEKKRIVLNLIDSLMEI